MGAQKALFRARERYAENRKGRHLYYPRQRPAKNYSGQKENSPPRTAGTRGGGKGDKELEYVCDLRDEALTAGVYRSVHHCESPAAVWDNTVRPQSCQDCGLCGRPSDA